MKIERTYPLPSKPHFQHQQVIRWAKWPFLAAAYLCPILNLALGGQTLEPGGALEPLDRLVLFGLPGYGGL